MYDYFLCNFEHDKGYKSLIYNLVGDHMKNHVATCSNRQQHSGSRQTATGFHASVTRALEGTTHSV